jgi:hypothetical protein
VMVMGRTGSHQVPGVVSAAGGAKDQMIHLQVAP